MSKSKLGEKNFRYGKKLDKSHIDKIRKSNIGKKRSEETKLKMRYSINDYKIKYPIFYKIEEIREQPKTKIIQVHCKNHKCQNSKEKGGWFTPTKSQLYERIKSIEHPDGNDGSYLYCSNKCKKECPLFNLYSDPNKIIDNNYTQEEYNIWRNEVLERADYKCEYCEEKANHVHHSRPQKLEPFFSLDPDYGVSCCSKCHYEKGHKDECSTGQLANVICK